MSDNEQNGGYEGGGFQESRGAGTNSGSSVHQDGRSADRGGGGGWNNSYRQNAGGQSGNRGGQRNNFRGNAREVPRDFSVDPPVLYRAYAVSGNKGAPEDVLSRLRIAKTRLDKGNFTARLCPFSDQPELVFMDSPRKEIILPWRNFAGSDSKLTFSTEEAKWFAKQFHPGYDKLPDSVKGFQACYVRLINGQNLKSPVQFFLTYTADGCEHAKDRTKETGYQSQLIGMADAVGAPIFNFGKPDAQDRLFRYLHLDPI